MKNERKKREHKIRIGVLFTLIAITELLIILGASIGLSYLFPTLVADFVLPDWVWMIFFSAVVGAACAIFVNKFILSSISKLSHSMSRVAQGDFDIKLETKSKIGEIQEIYKSFNLMARELSATEILQTDFVSNVSHEFKTPISAIDGYAMLLQEKGLTDEEKEMYIENILSNTKRLSSLVGNILLISKLDNQAIGSRLERYRFDEQIRQSIVLLEKKWSEKEIELDVDLEEVEMLGNESLTFHIVNNLIDNAIKFDPQGGELLVRLEKKENEVFFTVEDNGPGINDEAMGHIFDKFYQSDSSHKQEGNGLGLALVKRITDMLEGEITVENRKNGGCRFCVILPIKK